jgi:hypothetical protein
MSHTNLSHITTVTYWSITHYNCHILIYHTSQLSHTDLSHITAVLTLLRHFLNLSLHFICRFMCGVNLVILLYWESILIYYSTGSQSWYIALQGVNLAIQLYSESYYPSYVANILTVIGWNQKHNSCIFMCTVAHFLYKGHYHTRSPLTWTDFICTDSKVLPPNYSPQGRSLLL